MRSLYNIYNTSYKTIGLFFVNLPIKRDDICATTQMRKIKKLDIFIIKNFLTLLAGTFFVCLFVLMMQFTWRYIDELIGKGLSMDVFAKFFWYMALSLIPQAMPLAILLSSLISFGNMGERLELLAMKTVGVPLIRIMRPIIIIVTAISGASFYFQNYTGPYAELQLRTLLMSMHESAPALEIPEGIFYNGIPNINIYVKQKHNETGMLYDVIIYKTDQGFNKAQIVLSDSAKLDITADKKYLVLQLYNGEQFENLQTGSMSQIKAYVPYDRETFSYKKFIIDFDSNFNVLDANAIGNRPESKNMKQLVAGIDSMEMHGDSLGKSNYTMIASEGNLGPVPSECNSGYKLTEPPQISVQNAPTVGNQATLYGNPDSLRAARMAEDMQLAKKRSAEAAKAIKAYAARAPKIIAAAKKLDFDSLLATVSSSQRAQVVAHGQEISQQILTDLEWQKYETEDNDLMIRKYHIAWHEKIIVSLTCIIFFFIGAPLGSIIQKGGLGAPTVLSVLIFILYYILSTSGMKLGKEGTWQIWIGMWMSVMILAPLGAFLTYKANNDSVVFNPEAYKRLLHRVLGLRTRRHIARKEVVVYDPDYPSVYRRLGILAEECREYNQRKKLWRAPNYWNHFFNPQPDHNVEKINADMESIVEELSNTKNRQVLYELNRFPVIFASAHVSPFANPWLNRIAGVILPVGIFFWFRMWKFRLRLLRDMKQIVSSCDKERKIIKAMPEVSIIETPETANNLENNIQ